MKHKSLTAAVGFLIFIQIFPFESRACSCDQPQLPAQAVAVADAVFLAKVISFEEIPAQYERLARLEVIEIWKGRLHEADSVYTALNSAACGYDFQVGETYLIYADKEDGGRWRTHLCTRTARQANAQKDLAYLKSFSLFPLAVGNYWQFAQNKTEKILDTLRLDSRLYFRFDHFREFNDPFLRLSGDGKLFLRSGALEQVWVDFNADFKESWHVKGPLNLGDEWDVQLVSRTDTISTRAGKFFPCYRFRFKFAGADYDWDEWYFSNLGVVQRTLYGIAVFQFPLDSASINGSSFPASVKDHPARPDFFELEQNYPNPFSTATPEAAPASTIHYRLLLPAEVHLAIFDILGKEIRVLSQGFQAAGEYQSFWDGRDERGRLASGGVYFYRLDAGGFSQVKKLVLMRR